MRERDRAPRFDGERIGVPAAAPGGRTGLGQADASRADPGDGNPGRADFAPPGAGIRMPRPWTGPWTWDAWAGLPADHEPAPGRGDGQEASQGGSAVMSEDPDLKPSGTVTRLHPPRLPHQASLDRAVQAQIGAQLRTMYEHYVDQPIPDRLVELVHRLGEAQDAGTADGAGEVGAGSPAGGSTAEEPR
jgi:hypothetical protein